MYVFWVGKGCQMGQFTTQRVRTNTLIDEIKKHPELEEARGIIGDS